MGINLDEEGYVMATIPSTARDEALNPGTDLAQAGAVFNDATRLAGGSL